MKIIAISLMTMFLSGCAALQQMKDNSPSAREQRMIDEHNDDLAWDKATREAYVSSHPKLEQKIAQAILAQEICLGMSEEEVRLSWGKGEENTSANLEGTFDQWIYPTDLYGSAGTYLYFKNGYLVSWQKIQ